MKYNRYIQTCHMPHVTSLERTCCTCYILHHPKYVTLVPFRFKDLKIRFKIKNLGYHPSEASKYSSNVQWLPTIQKSMIPPIIGLRGFCVFQQIYQVLFSFSQIVYNDWRSGVLESLDF